jgi:hypothetical protein
MEKRRNGGMDEWRSKRNNPFFKFSITQLK